MEGADHSGTKFAASAALIIVVLAGLWYAVSRIDTAADRAAVEAGEATSTVADTDAVLPFASTTPAAPAPASLAEPASKIDTNPIRFEVVTTEAAQEQGLGGRANVPADYAMLFAFASDDTYGIWMKDMLVPLDIIWLSDDHRIIKVDADVSPDTYPRVFYPPEPVRYVLEMKSGAVKARNWAVGTVITLPSGY